MVNKATLLGSYGGDKRHCLSAWMSTEIAAEQGLLSLDIVRRIEVLYEETVVLKKRPPQDLLKFLATHKHETPFEKSTIDFQVCGDIASHIHCIKHRIGVSINSESARYKKLQNKWYIPLDWKDHPVDPKHLAGPQLANNFLEAIDPKDWADALDAYSQLGHELYEIACKDLTPVLGRKRAKESSRYFLPYCKQLDYDMMFNFRSFMHFMKLRNSPHAQVEIRQLAADMLRQVREIPGNPFQHSLVAFGYTDEVIYG